MENTEKILMLLQLIGIFLENDQPIKRTNFQVSCKMKLEEL